MDSLRERSLKQLQIRLALWIASGLLLSSTALAQAGPRSLNISGGLFNSNGSAMAINGVNFKIEVRDKSGSCVLYSEMHNGEDLTGSKGQFSLLLGSGSSAQNFLSGSAAMDANVYLNRGPTGAFTGCPSGVTLNSGDERVLRVYYDTGGGLIAMTPDVPVVASAYTMIAETLQGKTPADFIQVKDDGSTSSLNQSNTEYAFSFANWPKLKALIDGTSSAYLPMGGTAPFDFNNQRLIRVANPGTSPFDAVNKGYADGNIGGRTADFTGVGPAVGDGKTMVWDQASQKWVVGNPAITGVAGGDLSGSYPNPVIAASAVTTGKVADNAITSAKINTTGVAINRLVATDATTGTTLTYFTCLPGEIMWWTATGWQCTTVAALAPVKTVAGKTPNASGDVPLNAADIAGLGTVVTKDFGSAAGEVPLLDAAAKIPAYMLPAGTGTITAVSVVSPVLGGGTSGNVTISLDVGTAANQVVRLNGSAQLPAVDGSLLTGVNASKIGTRAVASTAPGASQVLGFNATSSQWEPMTAAVGSVTSVSSGTGLVAGTITSTGTINVDVGTTAGKIVQFDGSARYPANDGSQIANVNATKIGTRAVSSAAPAGAQVLAYNATLSQWEPTTDLGGSVTSVVGGSGLLGGTITSSGTLAVDTGTGANQIVKLNGSAQIPAVDGSLLTGVNAVKLATRTVSSTAPSGSQVLGYNATSSQWEPMSATAVGAVTQVTGGSGLLGGTITSSGTLAVDTGTGANQIVQLDGSARYPANDGSQITNVNATKIGTRTVSSAAPAGAQVLAYNATLSQWEPTTDLGGSVASVTSGTGLVAGTITTNGTINVDVGTGAGKVVQLNGSGAFAAIDAGNLYNVNASRIGTRTVSTAAPGAAQLLGYNATLSQWEPMSATAAGAVTQVTGGSGLLGGTITSSGTLAVDTGTAANQIVKLNGSAQIPAVDGSLLTGVNASKIGTRTVSSAAPGGAQVLAYNATLSQWEPTTDAGGSVASVVSGTGLVAGTITTNGTINVDVGTAANKIVQFDASARYPANDGSLITNVNASKIGTRTVSSAAPAGAQVLGYNATLSQWEPMSAAVGSVTNVVSGTGLVAGAITSSGTINVDVGTGAGKIVQLNGSGAFAAIDAGNLYNVNASKIGTRTVSSAAPGAAQLLGYNATLSQWEPMSATAAGAVTQVTGGSGLLGGTITSSGTLAVDTGTGANQIVKLNGTAQIPAVDGSLLIGVNASKIGTRTVSSAAPSGAQVLAYNATLAQWEPTTDLGGSVASVVSGTGLVAGTITTNGTINVDVGTAANKIVQLNGSAAFSAIDGGNLFNLNASRIGTRTVSSAAPGGSQVLGYNATLSQWEPMSAAVGSVTTVVSGTGLVAGTITSSGTINVDVGTGAGKIVQFDGSARYPANDGSLITNVNASKIGTRTVSTAAPGAAQLLGYNATLSQWEPMSATAAGAVTQVTGGSGLLGGTITSTGTLTVDTGTGANQIVKLNGSAQIPAVDGSLLTGVNASKIGTRAVSSAAPGGSQVLGYNATLSQWEPMSAAVGSVTNVVSGTGLVAGAITSSGTINVDVGTGAGKIVQLNGSGAFAAIDAGNLYNVNASKIGTRTVSTAAPGAAQLLGYNATLSQWEPMSATAAGAVTQVTGGSGLLGGTITSSGTLAVDTGTGANQIVKLNGSAQIPAVDGSLLTGINASKIGTRTVSSAAPAGAQVLAYNATLSQWEPTTDAGGSVMSVTSGTGLVAGTITTNGTINVDVGTGSNKIVQFDGSARYPANDGSLITNVNASKIGTREVSSAAPGGSQVLGYNATLSQWEPMSAAVGSVTTVVSGSGLVAGTITSSGTINVDVGTGANKIVQLNGSAAFPAIDAGNLYNVNASKIGTRTVATTAPGGSQVLGYNATLSQWEPMSAAVGSVTTVVSGTGLVAGTITSSGTLNVDVGTGANKIVQLNGTGAFSAIDAGNLYNVNASKLATRSVASTAPGANQVLMWNGSQWEPANASSTLSWPLTATPGTTPAGAPSYSFTGSTNTGLFSQSAGTLALATTGTARLTIDAAGNLGVGVTAPAYNLEVAGSAVASGSSASLAVKNTTTGNLVGGIYNDFGHGRLFINDSNGGGGVNLGPANSGQPNYIYVGTGLSIGSTTAAKSTVDVFGNLAVGTYATSTAAPTNGLIVSGNVGVGTATPVAALDVAITGTNSALVVPRDTTANRPAGNAANGMIRYNSSTNRFEAYENGAWANMIAAGGGTTAFPLVANPGTTPATAPSYSFSGSTNTGMFSQSAGSLGFATAGTARMTLTSLGRLGLGNTNPGTMVQVTGQDAAITIDGTGNNALQIGSTSNAGRYFAYTTDGTDLFAKNISNSGGNFIVSTSSNGSPAYFAFGAPNDSLALTASGKVGIGTGTPAALLDLSTTGTNSALVLPRDTTANRPAANVTNGMMRYNTSTAKFEAYENGAWTNMIAAGGGTTAFPLLASPGTTAATAPSYSFSGSPNTGLFSPAAGSLALATAGTTRMTVTSAGWLGIGTTSPTGPLEVYSGTSSSGTATSITLKAQSATGASNGGDIILQPGEANPGLRGSVKVKTDFASVVELGSNGGHGTLYVNDSNGVPAVHLFGQGGGYSKFGLSLGTSNFPTSILDVRGGAAIGTYATSNAAPTNGLIVSGLAGFGTSSPQAALDVASTGTNSALVIPRDITANRPAGNVTNGMLRYNTSTNKFEAYENGAWTNMIAAGGGTTSFPLLANPGTTPATAPSYSFSGATGTGLFSQSTDTVALATAGTARLSVNAVGNVGVGTSSPAGTLDVNGALFVRGANGLAFPTQDSTVGASIAIGPQALANLPSSASYKNVAIGYQSMSGVSITSAATDSVAIGYQTLKANTSGNQNVAIGSLALLTNTNGINNVAVGYTAMQLNQSGNDNTALGTNALRNVTGSSNVAIGMNALFNAGNVLSNTALGQGAGQGITVGSSNTIIGNSVGQSTLKTGSRNILIGTSNVVDTPGTATSDFVNIGNAIFATNITGTVASPAGNVGIGTVAPASALDVYGTGTNSALVLPRDTTANRPAGNAANGMIRYNTSTSKFEAYENGGWTNMIAAGGGTTAFPLLAAPGTTPASAPSYSFTGSTNTGLLSQATGTLALATTGTARLTLDANGNLGVGTTSPGVKLDVSGGGSDTIARVLSAGASNSASLRLGRSAEEATFAVAGAAGLWQANAGAGDLVVRTESSKMLFDTNFGSGTPALTIAGGNGNLGVGTISPRAALDVAVTGTNSALVVPRDTTANRPAANVANGMIRYNTNTNAFEGYANGTWGSLAAGTAGQWGVNGSKIYYNSGLVGIGTNDPTQTLDIQNSTYVGAAITATNATNHAFPGLSLTGYQGASFSGHPRLNLMNARGSDTSPVATPQSLILGNINYLGHNGAGLAFSSSIYAVAEETFNTSSSASSLVFATTQPGSTSSADRMTITGSGRVGIGTSTPAGILDLAATGTNSALVLPRDTTANRPAGNVANGMLRYNTSTAKFEAYENGAWTNMISANGSGVSQPPDFTAGASVAAGSGALQYQTAAGVTQGNTGIGYLALSNSGQTTAAIRNTALGFQAGSTNTSGYNNTYIGFGAKSGTGNEFNMVVVGGSASAQVGGSGGDTTIIGALATCCGAGAGGTVIGSQASGSGNGGISINGSQSGNTSIAIGSGSVTNAVNAVALGASARNYGTNGISLGANTGSANVTGASNILLGPGVGSTVLTSGSNNILIGTGTSVDTIAATTSNFLNIGNAIYATGVTGTLAAPAGLVGIGTSSPKAVLDVVSTGTNSALILPRATTANRPAGNVANGMIRYNTSTSKFEAYENGGWTNMIAAGGGTTSFPLLGSGGMPSAPTYAFANGSDTGIYMQGTGIGISHMGTQAASFFQDYTYIRSSLGIGVLPPAAGLDVAVTGTNSAIVVPRDTTANRPASNVANGMIRYNTSTSKFEAYEAGAWTNMIGAGATSFPLLASPAITTAGAPSYSFTGDTDTGMYSTAANNLVLASGGTARMTLDQNGLINIWGPARIWSYSGDSNLGFGTNGSVGLMTSGAWQGMTFANASTENVNIVSQGSAPIQLATWGTTRMTIAPASGYVGIATASPVAPLTIRSDNPARGGAMITTSSTGQFTNLVFGESGGAGRASIQKDTNNHLQLWTGTGAAGSETWYNRLDIDPAGNVGIGTNNPKAALDVALSGTSSAIIVPRDTQANRPSTNVANGMLRYNTSTSKFEAYENGAWTNMIGGGAASFPLLASPGTTPVTAPSYSFASDTNTGLYSPALDNISLATAGTARFSIDASGNVGIGIAPDTLNKVQFQHTRTDTGGGFMQSIKAQTIFMPTAPSSAQMFAGYFETDYWGGISSPSAEVRGIAGDATMGGTGAIGSLIGVSGLLFANSGTTSSARAFEAVITLNGGAVNEYKGLNVSSIGTAALQNSYGVFIDDLPGVNQYGIYQSGATDNNYFAGKVGIGVAPSTYALEVNGTAKATSFLSPSDARLKENVQTMSGLTTIRKMRGVSFAWKETGEEDAGVIAQELETVLPFLVATDAKTGYKAVKYTSLISPLIEATKELDVRCEATQAQLDTLERRVASVVEDVEKLKQDNVKLRGENEALKQRLEKIERALNIK